MLMKREQLVLRRTIDMCLVSYGLNYQFWTFFYPSGWDQI